MDLREALNRNPVKSGLIGLGAAAAAVLVFISLSHPKPVKTAQQITAFYTDDDGKTWFGEDANRVPPFVDSRGLPAYRAMLYRCRDGTVFVGRMEGYADAQGQPPNPADNASELAGKIYAHVLIPRIKRPGANTWIVQNGADAQSLAEFTKAMHPKCPRLPDEDAQPLRAEELVTATTLP